MAYVAAVEVRTGATGLVIEIENDVLYPLGLGNKELENEYMMRQQSVNVDNC
jgi:hypothetical protein